jgi:hypothetical protein
MIRSLLTLEVTDDDIARTVRGLHSVIQSMQDIELCLAIHFTWLHLASAAALAVLADLNQGWPWQVNVASWATRDALRNALEWPE